MEVSVNCVHQHSFMETQKRSKKVLKNLINDSMREAISSLQLPEPSGKVKKLIDRSSKKLAGAFSELIKKEEKKRRKAEKMLENAVNGESKKRRKPKHLKHEIAHHLDEPVKI
jgi:hypothetical protein